MFKRTEAEKKWLRFRRRHFEMLFIVWKCLNVDWNFTKVCSQASSWQYISIGLDDGLAPNRWQTIIWTNDVLGCRRMYAPLGLNEGAVSYDTFKFKDFKKYDTLKSRWLSMV